MRRQVVHELRLGSFADGQAAEPPDTALVGRYCTGQEYGGAVRGGARAVDGDHISAVIRRNDAAGPSA